MQPCPRIAMLDAGVDYRLRAKVPNDQDVNSAVYHYFQLGLVGPRQWASLALLAQVSRSGTAPCRFVRRMQALWVDFSRARKYSTVLIQWCCRTARLGEMSSRLG
jgi:hypothetical protein